MATSISQESINRDYTDNFSIKEMAKNTLVPKFFEDKDVSNLNIGLLGYVTELLSDGLEDSYNTVSILHDEMFPNRAKLPSSILSHGAIFQLSNGMATAATCDFILIMEEKFVRENLQAENGSNVFYIDKDTKILVEDIIFTLDYDIVIRAVKKEVVGGYVYSAQYVMSDFTNAISNITSPYININKSGNGWLTLKVTCHQCRRVLKYESIINNTKINLPTFSIDFEDQLAGFDIFYKGPKDTEYSTQLVKLNKYSTPLKEPYCFFSFTDEKTLTILFGNNDTYFQPDFNSECEVVLYLTTGKAGTFDVYEGKNVSVVTTSDRFAYNDNFFLAARVMSSSSKASDAMSLDSLQHLSVEGYRTATIYSTDNDLMEFFNNYPYRYGNECLFIKKRDDVVDRRYSGFIIMKKDDYIYPTNTLYVACNLNQFINSDINKYILDPGCLFTYNDQNQVVVCYDEEKAEEYRDEYAAYLADNGKTNADISFWEYLSNRGIDLKYTIFDTDKIPDLIEKYGFIYMNPFLISITKSPSLVGLYLTINNENVALDFLDQNMDLFDQFVITNITLNRELEKDRKYTFSLATYPSATLSTDEEVITVFGDKNGTSSNLIRIVVSLEDSDGRNLCFLELIPTEKTTDNIFRFEGSFFTDDHVTTTGKFRITDGITNMDAIDDMLVPMSTVVNVYVLYRSAGSTDNIFTQFDSSFSGYTWTNIYSTDNSPMTFIRPMNMIMSDITFKDHRLEQYELGDCTVSSVPFIGAEAVLNKDRFDYFIKTFEDQYRNLESTVDYLKTSTHIDMKFYNTYGKSKNFIIGDEVDGESLIDTINIKIRYYVWVYENTDTIKANTELKQYIKDTIESVNTDGTNNFFNSNMCTTIEKSFAYVHHIKFIGINSYDPKYQAVKNVTVDLNSLSKEQRIKYVPEILVANLENIDLTFFTA